NAVTNSFICSRTMLSSYLISRRSCGSLRKRRAGLLTYLNINQFLTALVPVRDAVLVGCWGLP
ncbi:MAG TPA: hypothetical protein VE616_00860, partial [Candidatus Udaeobacter sp.]|nr:hypothetical protein [Candidatus Udaeobacter sp.]